MSISFPPSGGTSDGSREDYLPLLLLLRQRTISGIVELQMPWHRICPSLKTAMSPYVVIASGDCVYKMDYNKVLEYHVAKKADITVVCKDMPAGVNVDRFGTVKMNEESRIEEFEEEAGCSEVQYDFLRNLCGQKTSAD